jgi:hypothetical protein
VTAFYRDMDMVSRDADVVILKEAGIMVLNSGWYFWHVDWSVSGPYSTKEECGRNIEKYLFSL